MFAAGLLLVAAAVLVLRTPGAVPETLQTRMVAGLSGLPFLCFPDTAFLACLLGLLGAGCLVVAGAMARRNPIATRSIPPPIRFAAMAWPGAMVLACAALA